MRILLPVIAWMLVAAAPAPSLETELDAFHAAQLRVASIGHRIAIANASACSTTEARSGLIIHDLTQYEQALRPILKQRLNMGETATVLAVVPGSAADRAGLRAGDALYQIGGKPVPLGAAKRPSNLVLVKTTEMIEAGLQKGSVALGIVRDGRPITLTLGGDRGCISRFEVKPGNKLNADAGGDTVLLTTRLVAFAENDDEVATVLGHELAHNVLRHPAWLAMVGRTNMNVRTTELEADRFGLYLMARAGYDPDKGAAFLERYAKRIDWGALSSRTHPSWQLRGSHARRIAAEIKAKQAKGEIILATPATKGEAPRN